MLRKDGVEGGEVRDVDLVEGWGREGGGRWVEQVDAVEGLDGGVVEGVDYDDWEAGFEEGEDGEGADVACASGGGVLECIAIGYVGFIVSFGGMKEGSKEGPNKLTQ